MNWRRKITAFKVLSSVPGGTLLYRFAQEHLTKSLDPIPERVKQKLRVGGMYVEALAKQGKADLLFNGTHLDFGTGWHPTIPLLFYSMGVNLQYLFDLVPVLNGKMVEKTVETFLGIVTEPSWPKRSELKRLPPGPALPGTNTLYIGERQDGRMVMVCPGQQGSEEDGSERPGDYEFIPGKDISRDWRKYLDRLGISYHAPYSEFFPSLSGQIDVVTSTQVLLHIPREPMRWCFGQIYNSLKPGGLFLATIHLRDLYADADKSISDYNHLRYSVDEWENRINSPLMSYNRFKARDYRELLEEVGFELPVFEVEQGTDTHLKELDQVPLDPYFKRYSREELAARHLFFIAQKK